MSQKTLSGIRECAKALAVRRGCTLSQATELLKDVMRVIEDEIIRVDGAKFVGRFTLEKVRKNERYGTNPRTGEVISIPAKTTLRIKVSPKMLEKLN